MKTYSSRYWFVASGVLTLTMILSITTGCKTPMRGGKVEPSGFLGNYSELQSGKSGQAQLNYLNPNTDFTKYTKIIVDPISVWASKDSKLAELPEEEVRALLSYLDAKLREELSRDYAVVDKAGPDVMRLKVALTEAKCENVIRNAVSSVLPIGMAISILKLAATGTHTAVGEANIEGELLDSESGERLAAAIDSRAGRKALVSGNFTQWGDVQDAFDFWAQRLRIRLEELRGKQTNP